MKCCSNEWGLDVHATMWRVKFVSTNYLAKNRLENTLSIELENNNTERLDLSIECSDFSNN